MSYTTAWNTRVAALSDSDIYNQSHNTNPGSPRAIIQFRAKVTQDTKIKSKEAEIPFLKRIDYIHQLNQFNVCTEYNAYRQYLLK